MGKFHPRPRAHDLVQINRVSAQYHVHLAANASMALCVIRRSKIPFPDESWHAS